MSETSQMVSQRGGRVPRHKATGEPVRVVKKARKLRNKSARAMMTWAFYEFSKTLEHLCNRYGSRLVRVTEEYTSKTCTSCGHVHTKLGGNKMFKCPDCGTIIKRDFNGALGIFLKLRLVG